jgi:hypothetical protein
MFYILFVLHLFSIDQNYRQKTAKLIVREKFLCTVNLTEFVCNCGKLIKIRTQILNFKEKYKVFTSFLLYFWYLDAIYKCKSRSISAQNNLTIIFQKQFLLFRGFHALSQTCTYICVLNFKISAVMFKFRPKFKCALYKI